MIRGTFTSCITSAFQPLPPRPCIGLHEWPNGDWTIQFLDDRRFATIRKEEFTRDREAADPAMRDEAEGATLRQAMGKLGREVFAVDLTDFFEAIHEFSRPTLQDVLSRLAEGPKEVVKHVNCWKDCFQVGDVVRKRFYPSHGVREIIGFTGKPVSAIFRRTREDIIQADQHFAPSIMIDQLMLARDWKDGQKTPQPANAPDLRSASVGTPTPPFPKQPSDSIGGRLNNLFSLASVEADAEVMAALELIFSKFDSVIMDRPKVSGVARVMLRRGELQAAGSEPAQTYADLRIRETLGLKKI